MTKYILKVLKELFSWTSNEFETSEAFRELERKRNRVQVIIQGRHL